MNKIIAFTGFKQTGKSTAAKYLESKYGYVRHNFKDALVQELKDGFPDLLREIMVYELENRTLVKSYPDDLFTHKPPLMRALMMNFGTEVRRKEDPDYWTDKWWDSVMERYQEKHLTKYRIKNNTVVDDVRFLNEAQAVKDCGGIIIRLTRPDITSGGEHVSETEQLQIKADYTIECVPGDHEHLYRELDKVVNN